METNQEAGLVDQGTGSTFSALADRGLVSIQWHRINVHGQGVPHLCMSTKGRQLARSWTSAKAYKAPPAETLKEWHWRALAKAYAAGDEGLEGEYGVYGRIGERTWERLRDYKWGALVEERPSKYVRNEATASGWTVYRMWITAAGRALYEREWARYRELYPDVVEALEPSRVGIAVGERS